MRGRYVEFARTKLKSYNKDLFLASKSQDSYVFCKNKNVVARIYQKQNNWYVWYEATNHRQEVENFSQALKMLEEEFS